MYEPAGKRPQTLCQLFPGTQPWLSESHYFLADDAWQWDALQEGWFSEKYYPFNTDTHVQTAMKEKLADQVFNHFSMTDTLLQQKVSLSAPPTVAACPLFLPILQLRLSYKGKIYEVLVNGQSGEVSGERPFSAPKILGIMAIVLTGLLLALLLRNKTKSNF